METIQDLRLPLPLGMEGQIEPIAVVYTSILSNLLLNTCRQNIPFVWGEVSRHYSDFVYCNYPCLITISFF